jgi:RNA recognition motif-containing protein
VGKKLYVGNLPYSVTETSLRDMFASVGEVSNVAVITDRETGRAKGFAFVEMASDDLARQAITQINGKTIDERMITVAEARPQAPRGDYGSRGGYGSGGGHGSRGGGRRRY